MFYEPSKKNHGLSRDPFRSLVIPRPIAWITSVSVDGIINLAPFSHFNICSVEPPAVMFSAGSSARSDQHRDRKKDSHRNVDDCGEFVVNVVPYDLRKQMNLTSAEVGPSVSEIEVAGLSLAPSKIIKTPRLAESPISLECKHLMTISLPCVTRGGDRNAIVVGEVVGVHIAEEVLTDGLVDIRKLRPVARLGYADYAVISDFFTMARPEAL